MDNKRTSSAVQWKKSRVRINGSANDRITGLPDEVLLIILSLLPVKDAVITSAVSPKFGNLWMYTHCWKLEIPEETKLKVARDWRNYSDIFHTEILKHTERVNCALELHRGPYLDELRIGAYRDTCAPYQVHNWINFAIQKGVKTFELKFDTARLDPRTRYSFPGVETFANLLEGSACEGQLHHQSRAICEKHQLRSFCCLRSISLGSFDVSEEVISYFLTNCMFLEFLRVEFSDTLLNIKVADGLRLKCLEIVRCINFESLKIYAKNLVSLVYIGPNIDVPFEDVPHNCLELTVGDQYGESFALEQSQHTIYLSKLERLKYAVACKVHGLICCGPYTFSKMENLKHLELQVPIGKSLLGYTTFFTAAPCLSTFKMEYRLRRSFSETEEECQKREDADKMHEARIVPHQYLQKVELIGFHDKVTDIRFAENLIKMAVCLKKMVLKFRHHSGCRQAMCNVEEELKGKLPAGAELVLMKTTW